MPSGARPPKTSAPGGPSTDLKTRGRRPNQWPLRLCTMKDTSTKNEENRPEESPAWPPAFLTPEQRRLVRRGVRIWARVAIRSYMRKKEAGALPEPEKADGEAAQ